jgi:hypothetical protein
VRQLNGAAIYLPGSRPSYFDNEGSSLTPAARREFSVSLTQWDAVPDTRWQPISPTTRNEKAIHDLTTAEITFKMDAANEITNGKQSEGIARLTSGESPLDKLNLLLAQSNLAIRTVIEGSELKVQRHGNVYSFARMSDGERSALVLIAEVVAAPSNSIFIIDEPELHLHRAITVPLVTALVRERTDSIFLISTHELELTTEISNSRFLIVRDCCWNGSETIAWDVDVIEEAERIPNDLRVDILGSRRKILFVEGTSDSLDQPMYSILFPNISVLPRESCVEVHRSVIGLRGSVDCHHVEALGIVDNDAMSPAEKTAMESNGIYPLPMHAVESLYYSQEMLTALSERQGETLGVDPVQLMAEVRLNALKALDAKGCADHLARRVAERRMRDAVLSQMPDRAVIGEDQIVISVPSSFPGELDRLRKLRGAEDLFSIIASYPVRESGLLQAIAKSLKFQDRASYEKAALARLGQDGDLREKLRSKLGELASKLL